jgi:hypothetical protein
MILTINSNYVPIEHQPIVFVMQNRKCWGMASKYLLHEIRASKG